MRSVPTPIEIRRQTGNRSKRPLPTARTVAGRPRSAPDAPHGFTEFQREAWHEVVADLRAGELFDSADRYAVETFCVLLGRFRELRSLINDREGLDRYLAETTRGTWTANTLVTQERETARELRLMAGELGLTAIARTKLGLMNQKRTGVAGIVAELESAGSA